MSEPRVLILNPHVSTQRLRHAVKKLAMDRYPKRLEMIHQELEKRKYGERKEAA